MYLCKLPLYICQILMNCLLFCERVWEKNHNLLTYSFTYCNVLWIKFFYVLR